MPVAPLQRPDELQIPNPSWMQTGAGNEEAYNEHCIPTMIMWSYGGKEVFVEGSWDDWKTRLVFFHVNIVFKLQIVIKYQFEVFNSGNYIQEALAKVGEGLHYHESASFGSLSI